MGEAASIFATISSKDEGGSQDSMSSFWAYPVRSPEAKRKAREDIVSKPAPARHRPREAYQGPPIQ